MATPRIALLNPNTDVEATRQMLRSAQAATPAHIKVEGRTAPRGSLFITNEADYEAATSVVVSYGQDVAAEGFAGVVIAGFSDPGLRSLRGLLSVPVVGIAEAGIKEAGLHGGRSRRYSIVAITQALEANQRRSAAAYGHGQNLASVRFTSGDPKLLYADPAALEHALLAACELAIRHDGAEAIVIGGGPLSVAADAIAPRLGVPLIEPVAAAMRRIGREIGARSEGPVI
ncbi:MAG: hydantoin racemase [Rhodoferax sp.]|nr:hydantoin racemase [Rhodoferax sp.]